MISQCILTSKHSNGVQQYSCTARRLHLRQCAGVLAATKLQASAMILNKHCDVCRWSLDQIREAYDAQHSHVLQQDATAGVAPVAHAPIQLGPAAGMNGTS